MDLLDEVVLKAEQAEAGLLGEDGDAVEAAAVVGVEAVEHPGN